MRLVFYFELRLQCAVLLRAAADLAAADRAPVVMPSTGGLSDSHWVALQQLLVAGANISKLLWGSRGRRAQARKDLRESIGVDDDSPLRDTDLRNYFEHMDKEIEAYFSGSPQRNYRGRNIGRAIKSEDGTDFGHYDPISGDVTFFTRTINVPHLVAEAGLMCARIQEALDIALTGGRRRAGAVAPPRLSNPPTADELHSIGLDPDHEIRPPGAPPRFPKTPTPNE